MFQLQIEVYDSAYPSNRMTEYVTFNVNRNPTSPTFEPSQYSKTVSDNFPLATEVLTVSAADPDGVSALRFSSSDLDGTSLIKSN